MLGAAESGYFILDFHQLTQHVEQRLWLCSDRRYRTPRGTKPDRRERCVLMMAEQRVPALRGGASRRFGCERVGCESNFVATRLPETENRTQHICSVPRCKATSITSHTNGRKS